VAVGQEANVCATNALARAAVGRRVFGAGAGEGAREFKEMVEELMQLAGVFNIGDFVPARVRRRLRLGSRPPHGIATERMEARFLFFFDNNSGNFPRTRRRVLYPGEIGEVCEGRDGGEISAGRNRTHLIE
jgi:hypothetical protein